MLTLMLNRDGAPSNPVALHIPVPAENIHGNMLGLSNLLGHIEGVTVHDFSHATVVSFQIQPCTILSSKY